ncbi:cornifelinA-like [Schistosoma japonicum]|nr:cornifelinA-like [Schistosoma japonicum]
MQSKKEVGIVLDQPGKSAPPRNLTLVPPPHRQWTGGICYCCKNKDWAGLRMKMRTTYGIQYDTDNIKTVFFPIRKECFFFLTFIILNIHD